MRTEWYWEAVTERIEAVRKEADARHQLARAARANLWAKLLPPLRRLEGWLERHGGTERRGSASAAR